MRTEIFTQNVWAMTGGVSPLAMDYDRGELYTVCAMAGGHLDAPQFVPAGSYKHGFADEVVVQSLAYRG